MKISYHDIDPGIRIEGEILRRVSPLHIQPVQRAVSPVSNLFFRLFPENSRTLPCEKLTISRTGGKKMRICIYRSKVTAGKRVGVLWIHGGGYVLAGAEMVSMTFAKHLIKNENVVVVSPDYTLSAKEPYPAALEDCYTALKWMDEHREYLGIECEKLAIGGESAGGGLTCATTLYARAQGFDKLGLQMPLYPMIDDRPTETNADNDAPVWNTAANISGWKLYLGGLYGTDLVPYFAAPARCDDLTGLPPAMSIVGDIEPFYAETADYLQRLAETGTEARLKVYKGCYHAFDMMAPYADIAKEANAWMLKTYREMAATYLTNS